MSYGERWSLRAFGQTMTEVGLVTLPSLVTTGLHYRDPPRALLDAAAR